MQNLERKFKKLQTFFKKLLFKNHDIHKYDCRMFVNAMKHNNIMMLLDYFSLGNYKPEICFQDRQIPN